MQQAKDSLNCIALWADPLLQGHSQSESLQTCNYTPKKLSYLHAAIVYISVNEGYPGSGHEGVESILVQVSIVLVPGNCGLLVLGGLGA